MAGGIRVRGGALLCLLLALACTEKNSKNVGSSRTSLPPVYPIGPANNTNWDPSAGQVILVSQGDNPDSAAIILPDATDSVVSTVADSSVSLSGIVFDLFGRGGKLGSSTAASVMNSRTSGRECNAWPTARLQTGHSGWRVAFVKGAATAIALDSIESLSSVDSAAMAASLAQSVAALPIASDQTFRRLPFRVRFAYRGRLDSTEIVLADIVRTLNEEANPRIEHILLIAERSRLTADSYRIGYYTRTAGAEETMQAVEVLAAVSIGTARQPAFVVNAEGERGNRLGLIERGESGTWRPSWWSAYTSC
jgi:hypothetical protein